MASNSFCQPCSRTDLTSNATHWCLECEEPICIRCVHAHRANKASSKHHVTDIEVVSSSPCDAMTKLKECSTHPPSSIDFFCKTHETLCCRRCITKDHRSCDDVVPLEDTCHNVKQSSLSYDTSKDLQHLLAIFKELIKNKKQNKENLKSQTQKVKKSITEFRESLITKLDEMEKSLFTELDKTVLCAVGGLEKDQHKAENGARLIETYLQQTEFLTTNGSNQVLFTMLNYLQPKIKSEYNTLEDIIGKASCYNITFQQNEHILRDINTIGSIETKKTPCEINIIRPKDAAAQDVVLIKNQPIKSFKHDFDFPEIFELVFPVDVDKDNNIFMADRSYVKMYNQHKTCINKWKLDGALYDLACQTNCCFYRRNTIH